MYLIERLKQIRDHRDTRGQKHPLWLLLILLLLGDLCGYRGYRPVAEFCRWHWKSLQNLLGLSEDATIPSYSTFRRLQIQIDPQQWALIYTSWAEQIQPRGSLHYAIDGKSIRCTSSRGGKRGFDYFSLVSVYNFNRTGVIGLKVMQNQKSSEIQMVRELLAPLNLEPGQVFSLDALHTQRETVRQIVEQGHHYLIAVKSNQPTLYKTIQRLETEESPLESTVLPLDTSHGRQVKRTIQVYAAPPKLQSLWANLHSLIVVKTESHRQGKLIEGTRYYITDKKWNLEALAKTVRNHWSVENGLHWVKDVTFEEDDPPRRGGYAPVNWAILNTWQITLARQFQTRTVPDLMRRLSNQVDLVWQVLKGTYPFPNVP